jgi:MerR family transcriptional regulator, redox-sensitive transcriptional activator SoxR
LSTLSIGEVARRAGINASAIRYYEGVGLLEKPERVGGKRRYDESVLRRLAIIDAAKRVGFTIEEVRTLIHGFRAETVASERWQALASNKLAEVDGLISRLRQMRKPLEEALRCDCTSLDECASLLYRPRPRRGPVQLTDVFATGSGDTSS